MLQHVFSPQIAEAAASRIFNKVVEVTYQTLQAVKIWPPRDQINEFMPYNFRVMQPNCRVLIDCTEFQIEQPFNVHKQQVTFFLYKNFKSLKGFLGIAVSGGITFISHLYGGSISDKDIFKKSGLLQLLEAGDVVLADKGFKIESELLNAGVSLMQPLFLVDRIQFTIKERSENKTCSNMRVHIERAISRIKVFKYFKNIFTTTRSIILIRVLFTLLVFFY